MTELSIKVKCSRCLGTGIDSNNPATPNAPCAACNATGFVQSEAVDISVITDELDWMHKKIKKILTKLDIPDS